ncbi:MAG: hypothetical protein MHM6MM_004930 [Cercozoa sp. M6MM]
MMCSVFAHQSCSRRVLARRVRASFVFSQREISFSLSFYVVSRCAAQTSCKMVKPAPVRRVGGRRVGGRPVAKKTSGTNEKKLQLHMKKLGSSTMQDIDEVNMFMADGKIVHFERPIVQAAPQAQTFMIRGDAQEKTLTDLLPGILPQLGTDNVQQLQAVASQLQASAAAQKEAESDDEVPDAVDFETVAEED